MRHINLNSIAKCVRDKLWTPTEGGNLKEHFKLLTKSWEKNKNQMANLTEDIGCMTGLCATHEKIAYSAVSSMLAVIAFLGNVWVIFALRKVSSLHPPSKLLLGCLASTDLCVGIITQPLHVALLASPEDSKARNDILNIFNILAVMFGGVSLLTVTAISVDRLLALIMGIRYRQVVTLRCTLVLVSVFWLFSIAVPMVFFVYFRITMFIICIVVLFCIITSTLCYLKIYLTLRNHQAQVQDNVRQRQRNGRGTSLNVEQYKKTVSSVLWVQISLVVCYLPYAIVATIITITKTHSHLLAISLEAALTLVLFNSSLNPFLYCWKMKEVRLAVKDTIRQLCCLSC